MLWGRLSAAGPLLTWVSAALMMQLDRNSDGLLDWEDLHEAMKPAAHHPFIPQALHRALDPDASGFVDFAQFARYPLNPAHRSYAKLIFP